VKEEKAATFAQQIEECQGMKEPMGGWFYSKRKIAQDGFGEKEPD
jgi:hypothetical protein